MKKLIVISNIVTSALFFFGACGNSLTSFNDPKETILKLSLLSAGQTPTPPTLEQKLRGIWMIGGAADIAGTTMVEEIDLYDPVINTWYPNVTATATGSYTPTAHNMAVSVAGKIYVIGGARNNINPPTDAVYEYDIASNSWTTRANIPTVRMNAIAYNNGGYIYLLGGTTTLLSTGGVTTNSRYDPVSDSWITTLLALTVTARCGFGWHNFNGSLSYAGGKSTAATPVYQTTNDIYIVPTDNYSGGTETVLSSVRAHMASAGYSGSNGTYFFLIGGVTATNPVSAFFGFSGGTAVTYVPQATSFIVYTPPATTGGIFTGSYHPSFTGGTTTGIAYTSAVVSLYNGNASIDPTLYIFGGIKDMNTVTNEVYAISANGTVSGTNYVTPANWSAKTAMPRARFGHSAVVINQ